MYLERRAPILTCASIRIKLSRDHVRTRRRPAWDKIAATLSRRAKNDFSVSNSRLKPAIIAGLVAMVAIHVALFWSLRQNVREGYSDLASFYGAGRILRSGMGNKLYDYQTQWDVQRSFASTVIIRHGPLLYNHAPFEAWVFALIGGFSYPTAYLIWNAANLVMLVIVAILLRKFLPGNQHPALLLLAFLAFFPVFAALLQGQDSILLLLFYTLAFRSLKAGRGFLAGVFLGLGLFKLHLVLPLVLILMLHKEIKLLIGFAATAVGMFFASAAAVGWHDTLNYPRYVWTLSQHRGMGAITPSNMPNLRGLLDGFLDRWIPGIYIVGLIAMVTLALIFVAAIVWNRVGGKQPESVRSLDLGFSLAVIATVLVSYHLYSYDASLLLLPIILITGALLGSEDVPHGTRVRAAGIIVGLFFTPLWVVLLFRFGYVNLMALLFLFFGWTTVQLMWALTGKSLPRPRPTAAARV